MCHLMRIVSIAIVAVALGQPIGAAQDAPAKTMAGILARVNHFPGDADKATLKGIIDSKTATAAEKTVAQALSNLQHAVSAADKPKLEALVKEASTPESLKTLSTIILGLNHMPSAADKEKLAKIGS